MSRLGYPNRIRQLMQALTNAVPALAVDRRPKIRTVGYTALNYREQAQHDAANKDHRGLALFQQDPNALGKGKGAWRLFLQQFNFAGPDQTEG